MVKKETVGEKMRRLRYAGSEAAFQRNVQRSSVTTREQSEFPSSRATDVSQADKTRNTDVGQPRRNAWGNDPTLTGTSPAPETRKYYGVTKKQVIPQAGEQPPATTPVKMQPKKQTD